MSTLCFSTRALPRQLTSRSNAKIRTVTKSRSVAGRMAATAVHKTDVGLAGEHKHDKKSPPTMYAKLGGKEAIEGVVDEFYARVFADDEVKGFFEGINKQRLKAHQVGFMTYAFGGPEEYHGRDMWRAHEKLVRNKGLNDHHFDVIVNHLVGALQKFNVPEEDIAAAGKVVETVRDPMFRDPKTKEYLG